MAERTGAARKGIGLRDSPALASAPGFTVMNDDATLPISSIDAPTRSDEMLLVDPSTGKTAFTALTPHVARARYGQDGV